MGVHGWQNMERIDDVDMLLYCFDMLCHLTNVKAWVPELLMKNTETRQRSGRGLPRPRGRRVEWCSKPFFSRL